MSRVGRFLKENWIRRYMRVDGDGTGLFWKVVKMGGKT